jgi:hypothetical protein
LEAANADLQYKELVAKLQQGKMLQKVEDYKLEVDGTLCTKIEFMYLILRRIMILKEMHNVPYAGHPGYQKIVAAVKSHYFWPGMKK